MKNDLPSAKEFGQILSDYSADFQYIVCPEAREYSQLDETNSGMPAPVYRLLPRKTDVHISDLLAFEGVEFPHAASYILCNRPATTADQHGFEMDQRPWSKLNIILRLDDQNRMHGVPVRIHGIRWGRRFWKIKLMFENNRIKLVRKLSSSLFRSYSRHIFYKYLRETSLRQTVNLCINRIEAISIKADGT